jgi:4-amino-4-deoxy-L-arabinose transferase-like glycosyltransferase
MIRDKNLLLILGLATLVYGANFWGTSIYILDEAKNAGCAMEMLNRHDPIVPTFNGELRTDKPPFHYYMMMLAYTAFGANPFSARLFSVVSGILTVGLIYLFTKKMAEEKTALYASLAMIGSLQLAIQFHLAVPDPYLILWMTLTLLLFYNGYQNGNKTSLTFFYGVLALACLTKGVVALVLVAMIAVIFILMNEPISFHLFRKLQFVKGLAIFIVIAVPWYGIVGYYTDGVWLEGFFIKHNMQRYTGTMEGHRGFLLSSFVISIVALLPFSVFIVQAVRLAIRQRKERPFILFCLIASLVIPVFFAFSKTILPSYPAPAFPFIAIILGNYVATLVKSDDRKFSNYVTLIINLALMIAIPVGVYMALKQEHDLSHLTPLATIFTVLPLSAAAALYFYHKNRKKNMAISMVSAWIVVTVAFFYWCYPQIDRLNPVSEAVKLIPDHETRYFQSLNPAFVFALKKPVKKISKEEINDFLSDPQHIIITYEKCLSDLPVRSNYEVVFRKKDLFEKDVTILLRGR